MTLLGIGYGNVRTFEAFMVMLRARRVDRVVDVRAVALSPGRPWLSARDLTGSLLPLGIAYVWRPGLGNPFRKDADGLERFHAALYGSQGLYVDARAVFTALRDVTLASDRTALLCGCSREDRCHRVVLLRFAAQNGLDVEYEASAPPPSAPLFETEVVNVGQQTIPVDGTFLAKLDAWRAKDARRKARAKK